MTEAEVESEEKQNLLIVQLGFCCTSDSAYDSVFHDHKAPSASDSVAFISFLVLFISLLMDQKKPLQVRKKDKVPS